MSRPILLIVIDQLGVGGAQRHAVFLASNLRNCGYDTFLLSLFGGGKLEATLKSAGVRYLIGSSTFQKMKDTLPSVMKYRIKDFKKRLVSRVTVPHQNTDLRNLSELNISIQSTPSFRRLEKKKETTVKRIIERIKPNIVHVHTVHCKRALKWASECDVKKIVYGHHNIISIRHNSEEIQELSEFVKYATDLVFVSVEQKRDFLQLIDFPDSNTHVVAPISGFSAEAGKWHRENAGIVSIGTLSNLGAVKGAVFLLDAARILKDRRIPVKVLIGGDGASRFTLERECQALGIDDIVTFLGHVRLEDGFLESLDIFVLPSLSEATPLVLIEAMSASLPIVASRVGGIPEVLEDEKNGYLVPPGDAIELATKLECLCKDVKQRKSMGESSFRRYLDLFSNGKVLSQYTSIYDGI
jgi:glycosyltransferase involved in cell wall biosynthesis